MKQSTFDRAQARERERIAAEEARERERIALIRADRPKALALFKSRFAERKRNLRDPNWHRTRHYPRLQPGMRTAEYIEQYALLNYDHMAHLTEWKFSTGGKA